MCGSANQKTILCLHGFLDNANTFDNLIPYLPPEYNYLAIDFPGHGLSSHLPQGFHYKSNDFLAAIRHVQNYFNWSKVSMLGHSYGGHCCFLFSSVFSKYVDFFIALEGIKPVTFCPRNYFQTESKNIQKFLEYEIKSNESSMCYSKKDLIKRWIKGTKNSLTEKTCEILMERGAKNVNGLYSLTRDLRLKVDAQIFYTRSEHLQFAQSINCDVLYIKAKDYDYFENKENVLEVLEILKKSARSFESYEFPGTHHFHLNNPEDIAPVINAFIERVNRIH